MFCAKYGFKMRHISSRSKSCKFVDWQKTSSYIACDFPALESYHAIPSRDQRGPRQSCFVWFDMVLGVKPHIWDLGLFNIYIYLLYTYRLWIGLVDIVSFFLWQSCAGFTTPSLNMVRAKRSQFWYVLVLLVCAANWGTMPCWTHHG